MSLTATHVIGASGRSGTALCQALLRDGVPVVPVVRDAAKWATTGIEAPPQVADLIDLPAMRRALHDATRIVCCAHASHAAAVIAAAPPQARLALLGSTRKFTRWPDTHGNGVLAGEAALLASGRSGVILHPTMIYGAQGENNVQRLASLLRRLPVVPLPGGGRALVQPIHQDDVTRSIRAALDHPWDGPHSIVIAGPSAVTYAEFVRLVAAAAGLGRLRIVSVPAWSLMVSAAISVALPLLPTVYPAEIRRLLEDKAFDVTPMRDILGVRGIPLAEGLARSGLH